MYDTVKMLIESTTLPEVDFITENTRNFLSIREATDTEKLATKFTPNKVIVQAYDGKYLIEFSDNLEKLMKEYNYSINEAMEEVVRVNPIIMEECVVLVDESSIDKIDLSDINFQRFEVARF